MSKRAKVRDWLLEQENGITFSIWEVATKCGVTPKDVSNMVSVLYKASALTRRHDNARKCYVYDIFNRKKLRDALKIKIGQRVVLPAAKPPDNPVLTDKVAIKSTPGTVKSIKDRVRNSPRSPLVMAIDKEIKDLTDKIKRLQTVRREFT